MSSMSNTFPNLKIKEQNRLMAIKMAASTGANSQPLGERKPLGSSAGDSSRRRSRSPPKRRSRFDMGPDEVRSKHLAVLPPPPVPQFGGDGQLVPFTGTGVVAETKRKRKSRWTDEKAFVPGMPTMLPQELTDDQLTAYKIQMEIEDCSRRLRTGDFGISDDPSKRSPSPEPYYDQTGKRLNTREVRVRQQLEQRRHQAIIELQKIQPNYRPPVDYKAPSVKLSEKVWIPVDEYPAINFVGLLIGPRGNTLKALERDTGARIIIRGRGSMRDTKLNRPDRAPLPGEDEELHAFITAHDPAQIAEATAKVKDLIAQAIVTPDNYMEMRKVQLRELAMMNGTLRPEDIFGMGRCENCGEPNHKTWECQQPKNVTASVICTACGGAGHVTKDCKNPRPGGGMGPGAPLELDEEYCALMAELGEAVPHRPKTSNLVTPVNPYPPTEQQAQANYSQFMCVTHFSHSTDPGRSWITPDGARGSFSHDNTKPIMRVNLAASGGGPRPLIDPYAGGGASGGSGAMMPWAAPPGGWQMPPGMQPPPPPPSNAWNGGGHSSTGIPGLPPPPPPPPVDFTSMLAPPPPPAD